MVLEQHKTAIQQFMDEVLSGWSPFFDTALKAPLPQPPSEEEEHKQGETASQWRGIVGLKLQIVKVRGSSSWFCRAFADMNFGRRLL
jgi:hypothetical protein